METSSWCHLWQNIRGSHHRHTVDFLEVLFIIATTTLWLQRNLTSKSLSDRYSLPVQKWYDPPFGPGSLYQKIREADLRSMRWAAGHAVGIDSSRLAFLFTGHLDTLFELCNRSLGWFKLGLLNKTLGAVVVWVYSSCLCSGSRIRRMESPGKGFSHVIVYWEIDSVWIYWHQVACMITIYVDTICSWIMQSYRYTTLYSSIPAKRQALWNFVDRPQNHFPYFVD